MFNDLHQPEKLGQGDLSGQSLDQKIFHRLLDKTGALQGIAGQMLGLQYDLEKHARHQSGVQALGGPGWQ